MEKETEPLNSGEAGKWLLSDMCMCMRVGTSVCVHVYVNLQIRLLHDNLLLIVTVN